jgi:hypothetical protein
MIYYNKTSLSLYNGGCLGVGTRVRGKVKRQGEGGGEYE